MTAKFRISLWSALVVLLLSWTLSTIRQPSSPRQAVTAVVPDAPKPADGAKPSPLSVGPAAAARPSATMDRFEKAVVLDQRTVAKKGMENRVTRLRLVKQEDFKYPLIRVADELRVEPGGAERLLGQTAYVADHVMVRVREGVTPAELEKALASHGATVRARKPISGIWLVSFANPDLDTVEKALKAFATLP